MQDALERSAFEERPGASIFVSVLTALALLAGAVIMVDKFF